MSWIWPKSVVDMSWFLCLFVLLVVPNYLVPFFILDISSDTTWKNLLVLNINGALNWSYRTAQCAGNIWNQTCAFGWLCLIRFRKEATRAGTSWCLNKFKLPSPFKFPPLKNGPVMLFQPYQSTHSIFEDAAGGLPSWSEYKNCVC